MKNRLIKLGLLLFSTSLVAQNNFSISKVEFLGDGCEEHQSVAFVNNDVVRFLPNNFFINLKNDDDRIASLSCRFKFSIEIAQGYQVTVYQDPMFGGSQMDGDNQHFSIEMNGRFKSVSETLTLFASEKTVELQSVKRFRFDPFERPTQIKWSKCGEQSIDFIADGDISAYRGTDPNNKIQVSLDSAWVYRVLARRCSL